MAVMLQDILAGFITVQIEQDTLIEDTFEQ